MKILISAFLLFSSVAFAQELDAPQALLKTIPTGTYQGVSALGLDCQVKIQPQTTGVVVTVSSQGQKKSYETLSGATYRWNPGQRLFFNSTVTRTNNGTSEDFVRSIAVQANTQYVVVGNLTRSSDRDNSESIIECVINL